MGVSAAPAALLRPRRMQAFDLIECRAIRIFDDAGNVRVHLGVGDDGETIAELSHPERRDSVRIALSADAINVVEAEEDRFVVNGAN